MHIINVKVHVHVNRDYKINSYKKWRMKVADSSRGHLYLLFKQKLSLESYL